MSAKNDARETLDGTGSVSLAERAVAEYMRLGAVMATEEHATERLAVCEDCPHRGKVAAPGVPGGVNGCTLCGCFLSVKPRVLRYFDPTKMQRVTANCPDGRWLETDKKYR